MDLKSGRKIKAGRYNCGSLGTKLELEILFMASESSGDTLVADDTARLQKSSKLYKFLELK